MDSDGFGYVSFDGSASYDPDAGDTIVSYKWKRGETLLAQGAQVDINLAVGTHTITLVVTDNWSKSGSVDIQVTVLASPGVPPVAVPPADFAIENSEDKGTMPVPLDGSASYDPDGDAIVLYQWKIGNSVIATGAQVSPILPVGAHTITLVVTDSWNMQGSADVVVTVYRPALVAPIANAGPDQTRRDNNDSGFETVQLDGSASYDPLGPIGIISYRWILDGVEIATGVKPTVTLPIGQHEITLIVKDDDDLEGTDTVTITILPALGGERIMVGLAFNNVTTNDQSAANGIFWNGVGVSTSGPITLRDSQGNLIDVTLELTIRLSLLGMVVE
ncbi:MAG: PKD domain-containing protein [Verrucomicrobia bacterium]|nr:PKD domain-containing protein [Verrucomicrobiota bacterium]